MTIVETSAEREEDPAIPNRAKEDFNEQLDYML